MSLWFLLSCAPLPNSQYFSRRGCANDNATSLREAAPTTPLSTSQYKCPMPNPQYINYVFH
ncbi:MAG: hypothetical protein ACYTXA_22170 [Nostoc sp.]